METDRLKAEGLKLNGFIRGCSTAWWPEGPADIYIYIYIYIFLYIYIYIYIYIYHHIDHMKSYMNINDRI